MSTQAARLVRVSRPQHKNGLDRLFLVLLALTLIAFAAVGTRYLGVVFNHLTRFGLLGLLLLFLLSRGYLGRGLSGAFGLWTVVYLAWVCATVLWSQVPDLTAPKALLQVVVTVAFVSAGYVWTTRSPPEHAFSAFAGMTLLVVITGILGAAITDASIDMGGLVLHRGLAYNPNLLGILVLMSLPWTVWFFHSNHRASSLNRRAIAYASAVGVLGVVLLTGARSSILGVGLAGVIYLYYAGLARYAAALGLAILAGAISILVVPDLPDRIWSIVAKGTEESGDLLFSRRQVWEDSLAGAKEGDLIGVGFGVSAGLTEFSGGFSAEGYGREKGNTALAVLEELGVFGFIFYLFVLVGFLARLVRAAARVPGSNLRVQLGLVMGTAIGLIANSQFEAWFVAPAAPASPFFWALLGCGIGLAQRADELAGTRRAVGRHQPSGLKQPVPRFKLHGPGK
jgi:hypothetical protein